MKTYPSKVDWWLGAILVLTPLFCLALGLYLIPFSKEGALIAIGSGLFTGGLTVFLTIPCRYILREDGFLIQAACMKELIRYDQIIGAELSSNPLSAPALSLCRVKILLKKGYRLISPVDREDFIRELTLKLNRN